MSESRCIEVAVVGGGCAAVAAAFELTRPEHRGRYHVTMYVIAPDARRAYLTDSPTDSVLVLDLEADEFVAAIPVGEAPNDAVITPDGGLVYVVNEGHLDPKPDTVSVIDTSTNSVTDVVTVGDRPVGIALAADGQLAYVANVNGDTVSVIDVAARATRATIGSIPVSRPPAPRSSPAGAAARRSRGTPECPARTRGATTQELRRFEGERPCPVAPRPPQAQHDVAVQRHLERTLGDGLGRRARPLLPALGLRPLDLSRRAQRFHDVDWSGQWRD
jgi:YVTN family beta-propeller protein